MYPWQKIGNIIKRVELYSSIECILYNNQINARALIGQSAVGYCAGKPTENRASSELLYKSNRPQVSMGYITIIP